MPSELVNVALKFQCPDCATTLSAVTSTQVATQIVKRMCRRCRTRWQLKATPVSVSPFRVDQAVFVEVK